MPTTATSVSRLQLDHPDLGHDGGSQLHDRVRNAWTKIGDNMNSRFFTVDALSNGADTDFEHNFKTAFDQIRVNLYERNTGTGELTRIVTGGSPDLADFTIAATVGSETTSINITNNTGGDVDLAAVVVHGKGAELIDDLEDVDTTTTPPEDGQALVWDGSNFVPGASGDASFKVQSVATDGTLVLKGGYLIDNQGREFATYDGAGSASTDFGIDLSFDLDTIISSPTNDTTYYLYIDDGALLSPVTQTDTGRKVYSITSTQLAILETTPDATNLARYTPLGFVRYGTGQWSDTVFGTTAFRRHDDPSVIVSPTVYTLSRQSIGTVGAANNSSGPLEAGDFPGGTAVFHQLNNNLLDDSSNGIDLTQGGTITFNNKGFFDRVNLPRNLNDTNIMSSTDAHFNPGDTDFSYGGWVYRPKWVPDGSNDTFFSQTNDSGDRGFYILQLTNGNIIWTGANLAGTPETLVSIPGTHLEGWHHLAGVYTSADNTFTAYIDGMKVGSGALSGPQRVVTSPYYSIGHFGSTPTSATTEDSSFQDHFFLNGHALTESEMNAVYSKRFIGGVGQIRAGHNLSSDSFIVKTLLSFYNLRADTDDDQASRDLSNTGVTFDGVSIDGTVGAARFTDGVGQTIMSSDGFFNADSQNFACGLWFKPNSSLDFTSNTSLFGVAGTITNDNWRFIWQSSDNSLRLSVATNSTNDFFLKDYSSSEFPIAEWTHITIRYVHSLLQIKVYLNGNLKDTFSLDDAIKPALGSVDFHVGRVGEDESDWDVEQLFYTKDLISDYDVKRIAASRLDHNKNISVDKQDWKINHIQNEGCGAVTPLNDSIVHKTANSLYFDFYDAADGDQLEARLQNLGLEAQVATVQTFDRTFTSDPDLGTTPIDTFLSDDPTSIEVLKLVSGNWSVVPDGNSLLDIANSGNRAMSGDLSSTDPTPTEPVRVVISSAPVGVAFTSATDNTKGVIDIKWTGYTKFVGGTHPNAYPDVASAIAASSAGDSILVCESHTVSTVQDINVDDVKVEFAPGVVVTNDTSTDACFRISGARVRLIDAHILSSVAGTLTQMLELTSDADYCELRGFLLETNNGGLTVTNAISIAASSERNYLNGAILQTAGTVTSSISDSGTDNDYNIRG